MSKATKRKHVTREVLDEFAIPNDMQIIVKIGASRGNNLHEAETENGEHFLISMPPKFRKNVWIKRGDFVIVDPIKEGNKVCGEIACILYPQQVKYLKKQGLWPEKFLENVCEHNGDSSLRHAGKEYQGPCSGSETESDDDSDLFVNPNHIQSLVIQSDSDSDDESSTQDISGNDLLNSEKCNDISHEKDPSLKTITRNNNNRKK